eukprot:283158-Chlamydomonas_euryale.AAC.1
MLSPRRAIAAAAAAAAAAARLGCRAVGTVTAEHASRRRARDELGHLLVHAIFAVADAWPLVRQRYDGHRAVGVRDAQMLVRHHERDAAADTRWQPHTRNACDAATAAVAATAAPVGCATVAVEPVQPRAAR